MTRDTVILIVSALAMFAVLCLVTWLIVVLA